MHDMGASTDVQPLEQKLLQSLMSNQLPGSIKACMLGLAVAACQVILPRFGARLAIDSLPASDSRLAADTRTETARLTASVVK